MELGQRLRQARLEAGLSQRQLCGDTITRNMLSQIENGAAKPSMDTLACLAKRLGKPISFFLEEQAVTSPNTAVMDSARRAFEQGHYLRVIGELADYQGDDPVFDREHWLLLALANLHLAEEALGQGRGPYAQELLDRAAEAGAHTPYFTPELVRKLLVLRATLLPETVDALPGEDEVLLLRARRALELENPARAAQYLDAAEDHTGPQWNFLRGQCHLALCGWAEAAQCFHQAESAEPRQTAPLLEQCYRELGDYKRAYEYACKQR